jgi:hypothetical protein
MPTYVVIKDGNAMKVVSNAATFIEDARHANIYTSKYQAKRHLKELDNVPEGVKIVELVMEKGND